MGARVNYSGLVIAGIGFFLTRFTVTLAIYEDPVRFYLAGVVPLLLGLGLAAFGVALAVSDVDPSLVRTTAVWCVIGAVAMSGLVVLTLLGSTTGGLPDLATIRSRAYLSNFLIGGSVGGTLTGLYAARNERHRRESNRQADRLKVLNRLLRHEVLNAVNVILAHVPDPDRTDSRAREVITDQSAAIERTINEVKYLAQRPRSGDRSADEIGLESCLEASVAAVEDRHPDADVSIGAMPEAPTVYATPRLEQVFAHLLENAIVHAGDRAPVLTVSTTASEVEVSVRDEGPGLPEAQRALLETGRIQPFDDPSSGFGLNVVRLLVEDHGGTLETDVGPDGTTITVHLPRADGDRPVRPRFAPGTTDVRPAIPHVMTTLGAAVLAGVCYGIVSEFLGGSIAGIGVFYGTTSPVVGWITHEFHSVVFGFVFAGLVSLAPSRYRHTLRGNVAIGIAWALALWVVAAGVIAPLWLQLLGIPASIPNLTLALLASHLAWGLSLGVFTALGSEHVTPRLGRFRDPSAGAHRARPRLRGRSGTADRAEN